jgi:hypothetical protein
VTSRSEANEPEPEQCKVELSGEKANGALRDAKAHGGSMAGGREGGEYWQPDLRRGNQPR